MPKHTQMEKYTIVIVLCSSPLNKEGKFDELSSDSSYLGGPTRMQAAVDISPYVETFIVVGGDRTKVNDMKNFLEKECKSLKYRIPKIIRIESRPDTNGNLRAVRKAFVKFKKLKKLQNLRVRVGILTNFYHLPRAMKFASTIFKKDKINFIPIAAEAVLRKHQPTYLLYVQALISRIFNEINGIQDWELFVGNRRRYKNEDKPDDWWTWYCYDDDLIKKL